MNDTTNNQCTCANCPGKGCSCGCQALAAVPACACGESCRCTPSEAGCLCN